MNSDRSPGLPPLLLTASAAAAEDTPSELTTPLADCRAKDFVIVRDASEFVRFFEFENRRVLLRLLLMLI